MKFNRHISLLLAFFVLVSNIGFAFNVRYCGNDITSVTLKTPIQDKELEKDCCGFVEKESHCCKDKEVKFEKKTDTLIQKTVSFIRILFCNQMNGILPCFHSFQILKKTHLLRITAMQMRLLFLNYTTNIFSTLSFNVFTKVKSYFLWFCIF
uniref:HYC_CC_PP family protein n=1 Tax=Flavobacterium tiangeerense TaxID=459471 RepID=UPI001FCBB296|nr:hypothetical protein [Flavobacterium tiangeerense]